MENWYVSDTHYSHSNIVLGCSNWEDKSSCRNFDTVEEMNEIMVQNINDCVKANDTLWHDGDWSFGGFNAIKEFRDRIRCKNINLILGNHDIPISKNKKGIRGIFNNVYVRFEGKILDHRFVISHYAMYVWNGHHRGVIHLHGHSHGSLSHHEDYNKRRVMDIGIDTHPEFRPYHHDEILEIMENKVITKVDQH